MAYKLRFYCFMIFPLLLILIALTSLVMLYYKRISWFLVFISLWIIVIRILTLHLHGKKVIDIFLKNNTLLANPNKQIVKYAIIIGVIDVFTLLIAGFLFFLICFLLCPPEINLNEFRFIVVGIIGLLLYELTNILALSVIVKLSEYNRKKYGIGTPLYYRQIGVLSKPWCSS